MGSLTILFLCLLLSQLSLAYKLRGVRRRFQSSNALVLNGDDGIPASAFPLGNCQGDCDEDSDCAEGLLCFQRDGFVPVPGCSGTGIFNKDYCYIPVNNRTDTGGTSRGWVPVAMPSLATTASKSIPPAYMLAAKKGPDNAPKGPMATPPPPNEAGGPTQADPSATTPVSSKPQLAVVAKNLVPRSAFPLKRCQGQCFSDRDCQTGLKCYKLFQLDPEVPGCSGTPEPGLGYCFNFSDYPTDNQVNGTVGTRIKMYWQADYFWQEETFDRRWCLTCTDYCTIFFCNAEISRFQFRRASGGSQIALAETNRCLERVRVNGIQLQPCNASKQSQWFVGNFTSTRFEIRPYGTINACVIQNHHPKAGELIYVGNCTVAQASTTNYWAVY